MIEPNMLGDVTARLICRDLGKSFGNVHVADGVSLTVRDASVHALIGPNGAGKTTLLNMITGYVAPDTGTVLLANRDLGKSRPHARARRGIARTFQSPRLLEDLPVGANIALGRRLAHPRWRVRSSDDEDRRVVRELATALGVEQHLDSPASSLPPGERRVVEVARALACNPSVVLLDEPFAGLTPPEVRNLREVISRLRDQWELAVLLVEHNLPEVFAISDDVTVLDWGRVVANGSTDEIAQSATVRRIFFGADRPQQGSASTAAKPCGGTARLSCADLRAGYGRLEIVHRANVVSYPGEIVCLVGVNGAGKTTLLRALASHLPLSGGTLSQDGKPIRRRSTRQAVRSGVCLVPDGRHLFTSLPVAANLELAGSTVGLDGAAARNRTAEILDLFPTLHDHLDRPAGDLSGGQQQLVALARALMSRPRVLLLDEPSTGLSMAALGELLPILRSLTEKEELTIIMAEQNLAFAAQLAHRVYQVDQGVTSEISGFGDLSELWSSMAVGTENESTTSKART